MTPEDKIEEIKNILTLIEGVDPDDTAKCDEINARVWCDDSGYIFGGMDDQTIIHYRGMCVKHYVCNTHNMPNYTHSVDHCLSIKDDGWIIKCVRQDTKRKGWICSLRRTSDLHIVNCLWKPTISLGLLHAIMQSKILDINNDVEKTDI